MFILTVIILYKIRTMLNQRPVCQTGLCESTSSTKAAAQDNEAGSSSPSGIEVADNSSLLASEKEQEKQEPYEGYCVLCQAISKLALNIRKKFTIMVMTLLLFQILLEVEYWNQEKDFLMND